MANRRCLTADTVIRIRHSRIPDLAPAWTALPVLAGAVGGLAGLLTVSHERVLSPLSRKVHFRREPLGGV